MKHLNVYDSVNRERLLGTHPRWEGLGDHYRSATMHRHVELQRVVLQSEGGWKAEVALVTYAPLEHLMCLRDFRLPGEDAYHHARRSGY